jgi:outer membrane protein OmpA-like peptidoglycan-associated protein
LVITGFYHANETNNSLLPNLGMARANDVKGYLSSLGVPSRQLALDAKLLTEKNWFVNDTLQKGIDFSFGKFEASTTRIEDIKSRLVGKPLTLYFAVNEKEITLNEQQRSDFADMIYYLDNVPNSELDIAGHTDNTGKPAVNEYISLERAKFVGTYLEENGNISHDKIKAAGFGPKKPIVPNTTKENKALNRRVEVVLQ